MADQTILLLDDDMDIRLMMQAILKFEGYAVVGCGDEKSLRESLAKEVPDCMVMDMLLSGADGRSICRDLKSDPSFKTIPVLMASAHPDAQQKCLDAGADDFIAKPFEIAVMVSKIAALIAKRKTAS